MEFSEEGRVANWRWVYELEDTNRLLGRFTYLIHLGTVLLEIQWNQACFMWPRNCDPYMISSLFRWIAWIHRCFNHHKWCGSLSINAAEKDSSQNQQQAFRNRRRRPPNWTFNNSSSLPVPQHQNSWWMLIPCGFDCLRKTHKTHHQLHHLGLPAAPKSHLGSEDGESLLVSKWLAWDLKPLEGKTSILPSSKHSKEHPPDPIGNTNIMYI